jgi:hypothetical protein
VRGAGRVRRGARECAASVRLDDDFYAAARELLAGALADHSFRLALKESLVEESVVDRTPQRQDAVVVHAAHHGDDVAPRAVSGPVSFLFHWGGSDINLP